MEIAEAARREERQRTWYCTQESGVQFLVSKHARCNELHQSYPFHCVSFRELEGFTLRKY